MVEASHNPSPTLASVSPKQSAPNTVVKSFRVLPDEWAAFVAHCEDLGVNPTARVRQLVTEDAKKK